MHDMKADKKAKGILLRRPGRASEDKERQK